MLSCFNTSHVVVYQLIWENDIANCLTFQYISCCSLSGTGNTFVSEYDSFQYISCCSLSTATTITIKATSVSIHLMLQFIRERILGIILVGCVSIHLMLQFITDLLNWFIEERRFNTSHVVVYLINQFLQCEHYKVSIHLMLQFILLSFSIRSRGN